MLWEYVPDNTVEVELVSVHEEVMEVKQLTYLPDLWTAEVVPACVEPVVCNLLEFYITDTRLLRRFKSYTVIRDEEQNVSEVWGSLSPLPWPDSHMFRIV